MGRGVALGVIAILAALVAPPASAFHETVAPPPVDVPSGSLPSGDTLDVDQLLYQILNVLNDLAHAPCLSARLVPSDSTLQFTPTVGEQATGANVNGGVADVGTNLVVMTYPTSCVNWAQDRVLGGAPQELDRVLEELLP